MAINHATTKDIPAIEALLNSAYRGDESKKGWTSEADLLAGELRTDTATLLSLMQTPGAAFLKHINEEGLTDGCVFLDKKDQRLYLGMLSVSPLVQAKGTGRALMTAAEAHAKSIGCTSIYMRVISIRQELIAWYERQGYKATGETEPFTVNEKFGIPTRPLEFIIMEKQV